MSHELLYLKSPCIYWTWIWTWIWIANWFI